MSLQVLAQDMASRGRGPDTMLVHMAPKEVAGLQALALAHGGSLTVNPQTGLPEAGFLKNLLPTLIGAGLMFATGGAAAPGLFGLSKAATIGLGVGGFQALRTGSLSKGLMAGLGAYGGAGLMGGVMGAGTGAISAGATPAPSVYDFNVAPEIGSVTPTASVAAPVSPVAPVAPIGAEGSFFTGPIDSVVTPPVAPPVTAAYPPIDFSGQAATLADEAAQRSVIGKLATTTPMDTAKAGIKSIVDKPGSFFTKDNLKYGAAALAPTMFQEPEKADVPRDSEQYRYAYDPGRAMPPTRMGDVGEFTYYRPSYTRLAADGGLMDLPVERMSDRNEAMMGMANGGQMYAAGGLSHLGDYSDGGRLLRGPGDGVSDNIPATIANKRPARLADGEFVVPARIVSELGNGSTEAGARKLYAMMDRVQKARNKTVGKNKVAVDTRTEKLLPA
jgi:hypothetical protein